MVKKSQISALGILQSNIEDGCDDYKLGAAASVSFTAEGTKPGLVQMTDATGKVIDDCQIYIEVKEKKEKSCDLICPDAVIVVVVPEDDLPYDYTEVMKKAAVKVTPACEDEELYPNGYVVHLSQPGDTEFTKYETKSFGAKLWRSANGDVGGGQPDDTCTWQVRVQREKSEPCVIECFDGAKHIVPAGTGTDSVTVPKSVALANVSVSDGGKNAFDCGEDDCKTDATPAERTGKVGDTVTFTVTMTCTYIDAVTLKKVTDTDSCDVSIEIEEAECDLTCTDLVKYTGTFPFNITKAMVEGQVEYDSDCNAGEEITLEIVGDFPEEVEDPGGLYTYPVRLVDKDNTILDTCNVKVDVKPTCGLVCQDPAEYGSTTFLPDYFEQGNKYTVKSLAMC